MAAEPFAAGPRGGTAPEGTTPAASAGGLRAAICEGVA